MTETKKDENRMHISFRVTNPEPGLTENPNIPAIKLSMYIQRFEAESYIQKQNYSLMSFYKTCYTYQGIRRSLSIYFENHVDKATQEKFLSLIESENFIEDPREQPNLASLAFVLSAMCLVNVRLELGSPDLMYVYN